MVQYKYDAWGKQISKTGTLASTLGTVQPFRYRGYVYDEETGLHYLKSRYYDCNNNRFLNCDAISYGNVFSYCRNAPVNRIDHAGFDSETVLPATFDTIDAAAIDAAEKMFAPSQYIRVETVSLIYAVKDGVNTKYSYTEYEFSTPHGISEDLLFSLAKGKDVVAYVHTHIYGEQISGDDQDTSVLMNWVAYVATPSRKLIKFDFYAQGTDNLSITKRMIRYNPLSDTEKEALVQNYGHLWTNHIDNCDFNNPNAHCATDEWPQEPSKLRMLFRDFSW